MSGAWRGVSREWQRVRIERKNLIKGFGKRNEAGLLQLRPCRRKLERIDFESAAQGGVGVVTQALGVGDGDQEKVNRQREAVAALDVMVADQTVIHPVEAGRHPSEPVRSE